MATRRKTETTFEIPTELTKSKGEFKTELESRISIGKALIEKPLNNDSELTIQSQEYSKWSDYNFELLRQSFNKTDNEYAHSYNMVGQFTGMMVTSSIYERRNPAEDYAKFKNKVSGKLDNLEKLLDKVDLLKSSVQAPTNNVLTNNFNVDMDSVFIVH
jgi:hypothetical protein